MSNIKYKTAEEIIDETVEYYRNNPRGIRGGLGTCAYITPQYAMCAVGRCLNQETTFFQTIKADPNHKWAGGDVCSLEMNAKEAGFNSVKDILSPEYKMMCNDFWQDLQGLHDAHINWINGGTLDRDKPYRAYLPPVHDAPAGELTEVGIAVVKRIKEKYKNEMIDVANRTNN